jgi:hypothetical protein
MIQRRLLLAGSAGASALLVSGCATVSQVDARKTTSFDGVRIDRFSFAYDGAAAGSLQFTKSSSIKARDADITAVEKVALREEAARLLALLSRGFGTRFPQACREHGLQLVAPDANIHHLRAFATGVRIENERQQNEMKSTVGLNLRAPNGKVVWYLYASLARVSQEQWTADQQFSGLASEILGRLKKDGVV